MSFAPPPPPSESPAEPPAYTDVVVITDDGVHPAFETHPPAGDPPVALYGGLSLERLPHEEAERYIDAVTGPGHDFDPARQFGQLYSFVRRGAPAEPTFHFDTDGLIQTALQLSRLVVPNAHCTDYAVRVLKRFYLQRSLVIVPLECQARFYAFTLKSGDRHWLTTGDAAQLAALLTRFAEVRADLPERVSHALWLAEWGARIPYFAPALINTISAIEALLNADRHRLRAQFVHRTPALADEIGLGRVTADLANRMYTARSQGVHGTFVKLEDDDPHAGDLAALQAVLRLALRRAIEDPPFAATFADADSVRDRWPAPS